MNGRTVHVLKSALDGGYTISLDCPAWCEVLASLEYRRITVFQDVLDEVEMGRAHQTSIIVALRDCETGELGDFTKFTVRGDFERIYFPFEKAVEEILQRPEGSAIELIEKR